MAATLIPWIVNRFFTTNGTPLIGGTITTYQAGTTTLQATYTDATGAIANANPVQLDGSGVVQNSSGTGQIWLGAGSYKFVIADSTGVIQQTIDNVTASTTGSGGSTVMPFGTATNIASANLVDLGSVASNFANITGIQPISSFGNSAVLTNPIYLIKFDSATTLIASASLLLPGGLNFTTDVSGHGFVEYLGSGVWRLFSYGRATTGAGVNMNTGKLVGRTTAGIGGPEEITPGYGFNFTAGGLYPSIGFAGASGLVIKNNATNPNTQMDITANEVMMFDASNNAYRVVNISLTVNFAITGINGLSAGTVAASTWYYFYLVCTATGGTVAIADISPTTPTLPSTYVGYARIGAARTDATGSKFLLRTIQRGADVVYSPVASTNTPNIPVIASGTAASPYPLGTFVPPTAKKIKGRLYDQSASTVAGMVSPNAVQNGNFNSAGLAPYTLQTTSNTAPYWSQSFEFFLETQNLYSFALGSSNALLQCIGWVDTVNAI